MVKYISRTVLDKIDFWLIKFPITRQRSAVLAALRFAQLENSGLLSVEILDDIAVYLNIQKIFVYEVASFYSMYEFINKAKYQICICTNISCMLSGTDDLLIYIKKKLSIGLNEVTNDGKFYLKEVECLASCDTAPVLQIDGIYYGNVTNIKFDEIISKLN